MNPNELPMFDIPALLERSMPRPRGKAVLVAGGVAGLVLVLTAIAGASRPEIGTPLRVLGGAAFVGVIIAILALAMTAARAARNERLRMQRIEEMVMLRTWPAAAAALWCILSEPMLSFASRAQALLYLASVLARYHRFSDAIEVHNYLLNHLELDGSLGVTIRVARAIAMLRDDRLFDADRAIAELRRSPAAESAGLALVELYRDVKTGHPQEAVEIYRQREKTFGPELAHRAADAHVLAAKAFEMIGDETQARACYERATLLAPPGELARRYPEVADLSQKFPPAPAPPEAA